MTATGQPAVKLLDACTQGESNGTDLRNIRGSGRIPVSAPLYWEDLLDLPARIFKPVDELAKVIG